MCIQFICLSILFFMTCTCKSMTTFTVWKLTFLQFVLRTLKPRKFYACQKQRMLLTLRPSIDAGTMKGKIAARASSTNWSSVQLKEKTCLPYKEVPQFLCQKHNWVNACFKNDGQCYNQKSWDCLWWNFARSATKCAIISAEGFSAQLLFVLRDRTDSAPFIRLWSSCETAVCKHRFQNN